MSCKYSDFVPKGFDGVIFILKYKRQLAKAFHICIHESREKCLFLKLKCCAVFTGAFERSYLRILCITYTRSGNMRKCCTKVDRQY